MWQPIPLLDLYDRINRGDAAMDHPSRRLWNAIRVEPQKWQLHPWGDLGGGFWVVGVAWIVLGQTKVLKPVRLARVAGAVLMLVGSMMSTSDLADPALVFSLTTVAALVALAVVLSDLALLAVGSLGAIQAIIAAANEWFPDSLAAAVALLLVGGGLVAAAIWIARRRGREADTAP